MVTAEQTEAAALALFIEQCADWDLPPAAAEVEWERDPELRKFWRGQVWVVVAALGIEVQPCAG